MNLPDDFSELNEDQITSMVAAFYRRARVDDVIGPMYPVKTESDWEGAEKRMRDFLIFRFGGSDRYIQERGHPRLRMRHAPFQIGVAQRDRWLELMQQAMQESGISESVVPKLQAFFDNVADFLQNQSS